MPDPTPRPTPLGQINWRRADPHQQFYDGDSLLVAVSVCVNDAAPVWELYVVSVSCDEGYFALRDADDNPWDAWDWLDVEWWVPLSEVTETLPTIKDTPDAQA